MEPTTTRAEKNKQACYAWRDKNREKWNAWQREFYHKHKDKYNKQRRERRRMLKEARQPATQST